MSMGSDTTEIYEFVEASKYNDIVFRSTLEARWAAFFDLCNWVWTYEPNIGSKSWLPDFKMTGYHGDYYVEVKPIDWQREIFKAPSVFGVIDHVLKTRPDLEKVRTCGEQNVLVLGVSPFVFPKQLKMTEHVFGGVWDCGPDEDYLAEEALFECYNSLCGWRPRHTWETLVGPDVWGSSEGSRFEVYSRWKLAGEKVTKNVIPFGKYRGEPWRKLTTDIPYCEWVLRTRELQDKYPLLYDYVDWVVDNARKGTLHG